MIQPAMRAPSDPVTAGSCLADAAPAAVIGMPTPSTISAEPPKIIAGAKLPEVAAATALNTITKPPVTEPNTTAVNAQPVPASTAAGDVLCASLDAVVPASTPPSV
jgi:hypothetical protein